MIRCICSVSLPLLCLTLAVVPAAQAATYSIGAALEDYEAHRQVDTGAFGVSNGASGYLRIGTRTLGTSGTAASALFPFALPELAPGEVITSATLSVLSEAMTGNFPVANVDLYGLPLDPAPVTQDGSWYFSGANDSTVGVTKLQDNFLVPSDMTGTRTRYVSTDISGYINSLYGAGAAAGDFATIRLSYDQEVDTTAHNRYQIRSRQASSTVENSEDQWPLLIITTEVIPEPGVAMVGLIGMMALLRRRAGRC